MGKNVNALGTFKSIIDLLKPVIPVNISISSDNTNLTSVSITEINDVSVIDGKETGFSAKEDARMMFDSSGNLWLHIQTNSLCVNIGKYYSCLVKGNTIVFWLGAEAMGNEAYVQLDIPVSQLDKLGLMKESKTICGEPAKDGSFRPRITDFSRSTNQKELEASLNKKLQEFLQDIFNDT